MPRHGLDDARCQTSRTFIAGRGIEIYEAGKGSERRRRIKDKTLAYRLPGDHGHGDCRAKEKEDQQSSLDPYERSTAQLREFWRYPRHFLKE